MDFSVGKNVQVSGMSLNNWSSLQPEMFERKKRVVTLSSSTTMKYFSSEVIEAFEYEETVSSKVSVLLIWC